MSDMQVSGTAWIYQRVHDYCEERANGIGGDYGQTDYKNDYLDIFNDAFIYGVCGCQAKEKYRRRSLKLKRGTIAFCDYVVTGEGIRQSLEKTWLTGSNITQDNRRMILTLCEWWDEWVYAWERFPGEYSYPRNHRAKIKASLQKWLDNDNTEV
jgi:hypothetical protein